MRRMEGLTHFGKTISRDERLSELWQRFSEALEAELQVLRKENDGQLDIARTTFKRGEIALVKRILALTPEVGPGSRPNEGAVTPESVFIPAAPRSGSGF